MKRINRVMILIALALAPMLQYGKSCVSPITIACPKVDCSSNVVTIGQSDVGISGYIITEPGRYCLRENISWDPNFGSYQVPPAAIYINSSNVELDLNGYTISGTGPSLFSVGVVVSNEGGTYINDVIVKNGTIQTMAGVGVLVLLVNDLLLEDLLVTNNGSTGFYVANFFYNYAMAGGIVFNNALINNNITLRNVHADFNGSTQTGILDTVPNGGGINVGAFINNSQNLVIENCTFNNNFMTGSISLEGFQYQYYIVAGLYINTSQSAWVENCTFNYNNAAQSQAFGAVIDDGANDIVFVDCQASYNSSIGSSFGFVNLAGLGVEYFRCIATGNTITGAAPDNFPVYGPVAAGFYAEYYDGEVDGLTYRDCVANYQNASVSNLGGGPQFAYGFAFAGATNSQLDHCIAIENNAPGAGGHAAGFSFDANNVTVFDCRSELNDGATASNQYEIIPNYIGSTASTINILKSVGIGDGTAANSIGIYMTNAVNCVIDGCLLEDNVLNGIFVTQSADCDTQNNVIKHNQIFAPTPNGGTGTYAIEDGSGTGGVPANLYYDNYALNYPGDGGVNINYDVGVRAASAGASYIVSWVLPTAIPLPADVSKLSNLDITETICT